MKRTNLLIVANTPSENTRRLAESVYQGAKHPEITDVDVFFREPLEASARDVLNSHAIIIGTTENFGYMSGQIKDFFERIYYPCLEKTTALSWALYIRGGKDGTGTNRAIHGIVGGMKWREVQAPLLMIGEYREEFMTSCYELGMTMAGGLSVGIFD